MKSIIIYHNPRCSKSREALQFLLDHKKNPHIIEYLKTPLSTDDLTRLLAQLALEPRDILRKNEAMYATLNLNDPSFTRQELILIMARHPILIERPIVVIDNKAIVARPIEKLMELM